MSKEERLEEMRLGWWVNRADRYLQDYPKLLSEFITICDKTPPYCQEKPHKPPHKSQEQTFTAWKAFILQNGFRPRLAVTKNIAKQCGMSEIERLEENRLGRWEERYACSTINWKSKKLKNEFEKLRRITPTYFEKNITDKIEEWKTFIAVKGYRPRDTISPKEAKQAGMSKTEREEELRLATFSRSIMSHLKKTKNRPIDRLYPESLRIEFVKLWDETPTYTEKNFNDNFQEWKDFIKQKGYRPRAEINKYEVKKANIYTSEQIEEMKLGQWAYRIKRRFWRHPETQPEFKKIWEETPTFTKCQRD